MSRSAGRYASLVETRIVAWLRTASAGWTPSDNVDLGQDLGANLNGGDASSTHGRRPPAPPVPHAAGYRQGYGTSSDGHAGGVRGPVQGGAAAMSGGVAMMDQSGKTWG